MLSQSGSFCKMAAQHKRAAGRPRAVHSCHSKWRRQHARRTRFLPWTPPYSLWTYATLLQGFQSFTFKCKPLLNRQIKHNTKMTQYKTSESQSDQLRITSRICSIRLLSPSRHAFSCKNSLACNDIQTCSHTCMYTAITRQQEDVLLHMPMQSRLSDCRICDFSSTGHSWHTFCLCLSCSRFFSTSRSFSRDTGPCVLLCTHHHRSSDVLKIRQDCLAS